MKVPTMAARSGLASAALCLAVGAGVALAQDLNEVTVTANRQVTIQEVGRSRASNAPIEVTTVTTVTRHVGYADLKLTTAEGASMLERRVRQAVRDKCMELDQMHPHLHREAAMCMHDVLAQAMPQVKTAIADASKGAGN